MKEWLIVGGGVHGCTIATALLKSNRVNNDQIQIIDPSLRPMNRWKVLTERISMEHLRSPVVHHIDTKPSSLEAYAKQTNRKRALHGYYQKPCLELFNDHCDHVLKEVDLKSVWKSATVKGLGFKNHTWKVTTEEDEQIVSKKVVLAIGVNDQPNYPGWAIPLREQLPERVFHIFKQPIPPSISGDRLPPVIVGGGITAAHLTVKLCSESKQPVVLIKRHPFRIHEFDSDPGWNGPKKLRNFDKVEDPNQRRSIIQKERYKGSIPRHLYMKLLHLQRKGKLNIITDDIYEAAVTSKEEITIQLKAHPSITTSRVVLATGAKRCLPGKSWLLRTIQAQNLRCAECGFPIVNYNLEWGKDLYVAGALAELEIGPVSRNISGARKVAERIIGNL
ncbi:FAD/NAD(P)-binding protein [Pseudalkalibacillus sp. SCS-8]|uniref:FAD/NAD(P)-binding protein n=1 Tax=Pseudalkalibacillus nanhaiensis TaxID=3115291 RepID=UPI0032DB4968